MQRALDAAVHHWRFLAERYKDVPPSRLSFDLLNEPPFMKGQSRYVEICKALIAGIREKSPDRLIFADGADLGQTPVIGLIDEGIVQSTHDYQPKMVSHYKAAWVPAAEFESLEVPTWPMVDKHGVLWNKEKLRAVDITAWKPVTDRGVPVHVGEWGCNVLTPHDVCLAWMGDELSLWKEAGWGWSMWNLRGGFGIVDSNRADVAYEDFQGHKLDRKMLELILQG
jgi:endoglucanase